MSALPGVKALVFDVFGTVVDWRSDQRWLDAPVRPLVPDVRPPASSTKGPRQRPAGTAWDMAAGLSTPLGPAPARRSGGWA